MSRVLTHQANQFVKHIKSTSFRETNRVKLFCFSARIILYYRTKFLTLIQISLIKKIKLRVNKGDYEPAST